MVEVGGQVRAAAERRQWSGGEESGEKEGKKGRGREEGKRGICSGNAVEGYSNKRHEHRHEYCAIERVIHSTREGKV